MCFKRKEKKKKSSFSIKNSILKMNDDDFSIQDFVKWDILQILIF